MTRHAWISLVVVLAGATVHAKPDWELVYNRNDIRVWARTSPSSPIRELKAQVTVEAPREHVWQILRDVPNMPEFMPYVLHSEVLGRGDAGTQYEYHVVDPPFVSKRDYVVRVSEQRPNDADTWECRWTADPERGPPPPAGVVRLQVVDGRWVVRRLNAERTEVTYFLHTDPGGAIPAWLANRANTTSLPDLMRAVQNRAANRSWRPGKP